METPLPPTVPIGQLLALSVPEKLALIDVLADSIDDVPTPSWHLDELSRREAAEAVAPEPTVTWEQAVERVTESHARPRSA
jgi:putative addiction module component (TIGR02574 family)